MDTPRRTGKPLESITMEQLAAALPSPEETMYMVGEQWATSFHAARGGNWQLARHAANHVRKLLISFAALNPKHAERIDAFRPYVDEVLRAAHAADGPAFDRAFAAATNRANADHAETGYAFIVWKAPETGRDTLVLQTPERRPG
jgi:hypothetical protein